MNSRFSVLDSFRGLAAICVVIYHMHFVGTLTETSFFRGSYIFVDFFFVLSGFVLTHGYGFRADIVFSSFIKKRFFRLYPLHFVMLLAFLTFELMRLTLTTFFGVEFNSPPFTGAQAPAEIIPNVLLLQSWLPSANSFSFNAPSWSISVEFYLYVMLFITLIGGGRFKRIVWLVLASGGAYFTAIGSQFFSAEALRGVVGFFGGAVVYLVFIQLQRTSLFSRSANGMAKLLVSVVELTMIWLIIRVVAEEPSPENLQVTLLFGVTVLVFSFEVGVISYLLKHRFFQYLGRLSYSIYLTHSLCLLCFNSAVISLHHFQADTALTFVENGERYFNTGNELINTIVLLLILALVILASHISYYRIELKWQVKMK